MIQPVQRRRAAVITTSWPHDRNDGAGHFVAAEVEELIRSGWEVTVLAAGHSSYGPPGSRVISLGGSELFGWPGALPRLREDPKRILAALPVIRRAREHLRILTPDRVVAHWLVPCAWPLLLGSWPGGPQHGPTPASHAELVAHGSDVRLLLKFPAFLRNYILKQFCRPRVQLRFVSQALLEELLSAPYLPPILRRDLQGRSTVRPAALDLPPLPSRLQARGQFGIGDQERLVVIVSRLITDKRVDTALAAALLVPRCHAVVLGSGPELENLQARFPEARFVGHVPRPEALAWMRAADVVLSASRLEGAPTVVREARALGVPVVANDVGDLAKWARLDPDLWLFNSASNNE